jgi:hypothetical protein
MRMRSPARTAGTHAGPARTTTRLGPQQVQADEQGDRHDHKQVAGQVQRPPKELVDLVEEQAPTGGGRDQCSDLLKARGEPDHIERQIHLRWHGNVVTWHVAGVDPFRTSAAPQSRAAL